MQVNEINTNPHDAEEEEREEAVSVRTHPDAQNVLLLNVVGISKRPRKVTEQHVDCLVIGHLSNNNHYL